MAMIEISVVPVGTNTPSVAKYVANALKVLQREKGVKYELNAMGTVIEGDIDRLFGIMRRMHEAAFEAGAMRVVTTIKIDDRRDAESTMESKIADVKKAMV